MRFTHLSATQVKEFHTPRKLGIKPKPAGVLWFACEDAWRTWIKDEVGNEEWLKQYKYEYTAELGESKLIVLKTYKDIQEFNTKFSGDEDYNTINWDRVRKETGKSGIFVKNPRIFKARQDFLWYSSFDICSVGVWSSDAIRSFVGKKI
uniref:Uncharacterized protein n=1 Tax=viral metagenome TaxID=1070528 RepID=A0A6C0CIQ9_9ZZZZ